MKKAFTLFELLVTICVIAVLAAVLVPVFAQAKEKLTPERQCLTNIKQVGMALVLYSCDYDNYLPSVDFTENGYDVKIEDQSLWFSNMSNNQNTISSSSNPLKTTYAGLLIPYIRSTEIYICPSDKNLISDNRMTSYVLRYWISCCNSSNSGKWKTSVKNSPLENVPLKSVPEKVFEKPAQSVIIHENFPFHDEMVLEPDVKFNCVYLDGHAQTTKLSDFSRFKDPTDYNWPKYWGFPADKYGKYKDYYSLADTFVEKPDDL